MSNTRAALPTYAQSCDLEKRSLCHILFSYQLKDPILIIITLAAVLGSFCLLSGLMLLCLVSKTLNDQMSEAILLIGIGFFISSVACVSWKLTNATRLTQLIDAIKEETV